MDCKAKGAGRSDNRPMSQDSYSTELAAGNALVQQSQAVATTDFTQARALWQQAGQHFFRAHQADNQQAEAAFRLAQAWMAEAYALQKEGSPNALVMWANAAAQCELAFDLAPDNGRIAMTAASCHHFAAEADAAQAWRQIGERLLAQASPPDDASSPDIS